MRGFFLFILILGFSFSSLIGQSDIVNSEYEKHGVVWSFGLFKSWLKDQNVAFNKIDNEVDPIFSESYKQGFAIQSHYMYKPTKFIGLVYMLV
jgi:hypothetical protein